MGWKDWSSKESWEGWKESESWRGWKRKGDWNEDWKRDWETKEKKDWKDWSEDGKRTWIDSKEDVLWNATSSRHHPIPQTPAPAEERTKEEKLAPLAPVIIQKDQPNPGFFQHLLPTTPAQAFKAQKAPMTPAEALTNVTKQSPSTPANLRPSRLSPDAMLTNILDKLQKQNPEAWKAYTAAKALQPPGVGGPRLPSAAQMRDWGLPLSLWKKDVCPSHLTNTCKMICKCIHIPHSTRRSRWRKFLEYIAHRTTQHKESQGAERAFLRLRAVRRIWSIAPRLFVFLEFYSSASFRVRCPL